MSTGVKPAGVRVSLLQYVFFFFVCNLGSDQPLLAGCFNLGLLSLLNGIFFHRFFSFSLRPHPFSFLFFLTRESSGYSFAPFSCRACFWTRFAPSIHSPFSLFCMYSAPRMAVSISASDSRNTGLDEKLNTKAKNGQFRSNQSQDDQMVS